MVDSSVIVLSDDDDSSPDEKHQRNHDPKPSSYLPGGPLNTSFRRARRGLSTASTGEDNSEERDKVLEVTNTLPDEVLSAGSVADGAGEELLNTNPIYQHTALQMIDSTTDDSVTSEAQSTSPAAFSEPGKTSFDSAGEAIPDTWAGERDSSDMHEYSIRSSPLLSEQPPPRCGATGEHNSSASLVAVSGISPTRSGSPSQSASDDSSAASSPSPSVNPTSSPVPSITPASQTSAVDDIATINTKLGEIETQLTEAIKARDQGNADLRALSTESTVLGQRIKQRKDERQPLYEQRRELEKNIKDMNNEIKGFEAEMRIKDIQVEPIAEARDKAQDLMNELAHQKRKQERRLKHARYLQTLEQDVPDPRLREVARGLKYGRETFGILSDTESDDEDEDSDESMDSEDEQASNFSGDEDIFADDDEEPKAGRHSSTHASESPSPTSARSASQDHLDEFVSSYTKLARKDPKNVTLAEFSAMGLAFTKFNGNGNIKPELDNDDKAAVKSEIKSEIKSEPFVKTEPGATPEPPGQPTATNKIKSEDQTIKHDPSLVPPASSPTPTYPALEDLNLSNLTADMLAKDIQAAQLLQARINRALELLGSPVAASGPESASATTSTAQSRPPSNTTSHPACRRSFRKRPAGYDSDSDSDDTPPKLRKRKRMSYAISTAPAYEAIDTDPDDDDNNDEESPGEDESGSESDKEFHDEDAALSGMQKAFLRTKQARKRSKKAKLRAD